MVYRVFVEKKKEFANEARALMSDVRELLGIKELEKIRIYNRYDVENISEELFKYAVGTVFSEPQVDLVYDEFPYDEAQVFAVEYLPGQFDQRADSAAQCIQIISQGERPLARSAKVYAAPLWRLSAPNIARTNSVRPAPTRPIIPRISPRRSEKLTS